MQKRLRRSQRSSQPSPDKGLGLVREPKDYGWEPEGYTWERMQRWHKTYPPPTIRSAVSSARVKNWGENDDFGQGFMESVSVYGEVGTHNASLKKLNAILQDMILGWDIETQEETCVEIEREMRDELTKALQGSYKARRVT